MQLSTRLFRALFGVVSALTIFFSSLFYPVVISPPDSELSFDFLEYPSEAVLTLEQSGLSVAELIGRADDDDSDIFVESQGYSDINGLVLSPYYTASIGETEIPVYAATVFIGSTSSGALHSFSEIYFDVDSEFSFNIEIKSEFLTLRNAVVLPSSLGVGVKCSRGVATASISDFGIYTFLFNNAGQEHAYTLFVRERVDEDAEIQALVSEYGKENVTVFEKGVYLFDNLHIDSDNTVIYLKTGAYLIANHRIDIMSESDDLNRIEENAFASNACGLTRFPFINFYNCDNVKLLGRGVIDLSHLDRRERRGVVFTLCDNIEIDGIKIVNSPEWSLITYKCNGVTIKDTDIFGYRINSDAFAVCNSQNVSVDSCFARSGDDLFDVKALGGDETAVSENIVFTRCVAWAGKARCFGICGEVVKRISGVRFADCSVIIRDGTWDDNRIASLAIVVEQGGGSVSDISFENIEIFRDDGRAIGCLIYGEDIENFCIENVSFRNISYTSRLPSKIALNDSDSNRISVELEGLRVSGIELKNIRLPFFDIGKGCEVTLK